MTPSTIKERRYWQELVAWEMKPDYNRKTITVGSGHGELLPGTIMGKNSTDGKYAPHDPAATNGTENISGILYSHIDTTTDQEAVVLEQGPAIANATIFLLEANAALDKTASITALMENCQIKVLEAT